MRECVCVGTCKGLKMMSDPLELELQDGSNHIGAGNETLMCSQVHALNC